MNKIVNELNSNYEPTSYSKNYVEQIILDKNKEIEDLQKRYDCLMEAHKISDEDNERLNNKYNKALELLTDFNMPCECCDCKISDEYCEENCGVDDESYKKCWDKYIELELREDK